MDNNLVSVNCFNREYRKLINRLYQTLFDEAISFADEYIEEYGSFGINKQSIDSFIYHQDVLVSDLNGVYLDVRVLEEKNNVACLYHRSLSNKKLTFNIDFVDNGCVVERLYSESAGHLTKFTKNCRKVLKYNEKDKLNEMILEFLSIN